MSDFYTNGLRVGTKLTTDKAVTEAIVRKDGILFTFKSPFGDETRKKLPITVDQYSRWLNGELIQNCMPAVSVDDRELFLTGMNW